MCGIAGFLLRRASAIAEPQATIRRMAASLQHRGPDGEDVWSNGELFLGHRRLAIIDRAGGHQPMVSDVSACVLVYNGEIYNYRELRAGLAARGHRFRTESDTEVVLRAYEEFGAGCVERFNGMFAFALWDPARAAVFLARDRLGKKPLYYTNTPGFFAFASEPKGLMTVPEVRQSATPDPRALSDFLSLGYVLSPKSVYRNIQRLPGATYAFVTAAPDDLGAVDYWPIARQYESVSDATQGQQLEQFGALLEDAVTARLHADVPVGVYLSGGIDSAAVAEVVRRVAPDPKAFCVGFDDPSYDESAGAGVTARHLGLDLTILRSDGEVPTAATLLSTSDEPFADTSLIASLSLNKAARAHVTVALSGDGADELFAGYPTYLADRLYAVYRHVPAPLQSLLAAGASRLRPSYRKVAWDYKVRQFFGAKDLSPRRAHYWWRTVFSETEKQRMMPADVLAACDGYDPFDTFAARFEDVSQADFLSQCLYVDLKTWLQDDILVKVDRASMAYGLEVRCPFLDHRMVEFAARLPARAKFGWRRRKPLLRAFLADKLPRSVVAGVKRGFNAPTSGVGVLRAPRAEARGWLVPNYGLRPDREDVTYKSLVLALLDEFAARGVGASGVGASHAT